MSAITLLCWIIIYLIGKLLFSMIVERNYYHSVMIILLLNILYINMLDVVKCASCKPSNLPQAGLIRQYRNINFSSQLISCDLLGPHPHSRKGNQFVLVVVNSFFKFTLCSPLIASHCSCYR